MKSHLATYLRAAVLLSLLLSATAAADAVKLAAFWIEGVDVRTISDGQLIYVTATGGEVAKALSEVEGIRLQRHPELEQAAAATEAGEHARAAGLLRQVRQKARQDWVEHYATKLLVNAAAAAAQPLEAAQLYVGLVRDEVDPFFIPEAPTQAVSAAEDDVRQRIAGIVRPALERAAGDRRARLQSLLDAALQEEAPAGAVGRAEGGPGEAAGDAAAAEAESAVTLPQDIIGKPSGDPLIDPIVDLLRKGEFNQALAAAETAVRSSGRLSDKLYLLGKAQLAVADESGELSRYKDAGLSFMRVVIYFPRSGVAGPSLLEAGYVHEKIGREDLARKLYDRARLVIDPEAEPAYHQRLLDVTK